MPRYENILFDLDGTLTDPRLGITRSVQYALNKMGIKENDLDKLTRFIGPPLAYSFQDFYGFDEKEAWQAVEFYREYFAVKGIFENRVYEGIPELLQELYDCGLTLAVATSKPTVFAEKILRHFAIDKYFAAVVGSHLDGSRVDKGEVIEETLKVLGIDDAGKAVMVGDRKHDIIGAHRNNVKAVAVGYGYGCEEEFRQAGADYVVWTVEELKIFLLGNEIKAGF